MFDSKIKEIIGLSLVTVRYLSCPNISVIVGYQRNQAVRKPSDRPSQFALGEKNNIW